MSIGVPAYYLRDMRQGDALWLRAMGRPPLNVKETKVRLTDDTRQRIESLVGPQRMAAFIREAVDAELDRREAQDLKSAAKRKAAKR